MAPAVAPAPAVERQDAGETPDVVADLDDDEDEELPAGFVQSVQGNYFCAFQVRLSAEPARAPGSWHGGSRRGGAGEDQRGHPAGGVGLCSCGALLCGGGGGPCGDGALPCGGGGPCGGGLSGSSSGGRGGGSGLRWWRRGGGTTAPLLVMVAQHPPMPPAAFPEQSGCTLIVGGTNAG